MPVLPPHNQHSQRQLSQNPGNSVPIPGVVPGITDTADTMHAGHHHLEFVRQVFFDDLDSNPVVGTHEGSQGGVLVGPSGTGPEHHSSIHGGPADFADPAVMAPLRSSGGVPPRRRPTKPRIFQLSETEKKARHNAHTRSSRLRIDNGLDRLKQTLKKVRPTLKLSKKADIVDEAVRLICESHDIPLANDDEDHVVSQQDPVDAVGASSMSV